MTSDRPGDAWRAAAIAPPLVKLGRDGGIVDAFLVPWDSEVFGFPVAEIRRFELAEGQDGRGALEPFDAWCQIAGVKLASCRLDHARLRESMAVEDGGFRFIEMVHVPRFDLGRPVDRPTTRLQISEAGTEDLPRLEAIAADAFTTGRFRLDWRLPPELGDRRYASWVRTSLDSPTQTVLKAELDGTLIGFFIVERREDGVTYWHLTAIAPEFQGRGLGLSLWQTMLDRARVSGSHAVETTISGHNSAALSLYSRLGFRFTSAQMTFHRLSEEPARS